MISVIFLSVLLSTVHAQNLGERGGGLLFNVSLGTTSAPDNWTVSDGGSAPINFRIVLPTFTQIPYNLTPIVNITPMNGTLAPGQQLQLQVRVTMPSNDSPGLKWDNIAQIIAVPANQGPGATVEGGLGKEIIIYSKAPPPSPWPIVIEVLVILVAIALVIFGISSYYLYKVRPNRAKALRGAKAPVRGRSARGSAAARARSQTDVERELAKTKAELRRLKTAKARARTKTKARRTPKKARRR